MTKAELLRIQSSGTDLNSGDVEEIVLDAVPIMDIATEMSKLRSAMSICCCEMEQYLSANEKK